MNHTKTAARLVLGNRNADYGTPKDDFTALAKVWTGLLERAGVLQPGKELSAEHVVIMMVALKLNRHMHRAKADNIVDAHGYLLCLEWIETGKRPRS